jgi:DeoR/GlpR family transcriptional regulator of sugar metabolism
MNTSDKILKFLQQNGKGFRAIDIAKEVKLSRSTIHRNLSSLQLRGKVEERNSLWYFKQNNQNPNPIKIIMEELKNLSLEQAEFRAEIQFIYDNNPYQTDPETDINILHMKINELEKLKNNLIKQLKLSFDT